MSKKTNVEQIQPVVDGPVYGPVSNPADFVKSQQFAHEHTENVARDFLTGGCGNGPQVAGFEFTPIGGLNVRIFAPGHIVDQEGRSYDLIGASSVDLAIATADPGNPRVDLIYAKIEIDVEAESELRPFVRLRTQQELEAGAAPYPPQQFNEPTELHNRATVLVRTGTPAPQPQAPALNANEVALYEIHVRAGASSLGNSDVTDVRDAVRSLRCAWGEIDALKARTDDIEKADHDHPARRIFIEGQGPYAGKKVQDFIDDFSFRSEESTYDPLIAPEILTPELAPNHANAGTLVSVGDLDNGIPVVDMPKDRKVVFSNVTHIITPEKFPTALNARFVNKDVQAGQNTATNQLNLSLAVVNSVESDGSGTFSLQNYSMPSPRIRNVLGGRLAAARNGQLLEVFGGAYNQGDSSWHTVDTIAGTVTQRAFVGDIPTHAIIFAAPMGDGMHVLIAERAGPLTTDGRGALRWYKVNAQTGQSTRFANAPGTTAAPSLPPSNAQQEAAVVGDLIQANVIFLLVSAPAAGFSLQYWVYHVDTNQFEQINPIGQSPPFRLSGQEPPLNFATPLLDVDCCLYQPGKAIILVAWSFAPAFIFDYSTRTLTRLQISEPYSDFISSFVPDQPEAVVRIGRLTGPSMANVGGRILLASGFSSIWELIPGTPPQWRRIDTALESAKGTRGYAGMVSLLSDGLPKGRGYLIGGVISQPVTPKADIWEFDDAGIVETICDGLPALTLGAGATQASFSVPDYALDWAVGKLLVTLRGHLPAGTIKLSYSFDGLNFQEVMRDQVATILNSDNPAIRKLRITLIGVGSVKPCLIGLTERFEQGGIASPGFQQLVLRYNANTAGVTGLYINRAGEITLEGGIVESTPDKALLHVVTPQGPNTAPIVKDIINQRLVHRKFEGTKAGGVDPVITNRLPRRPRFIQAFKIVAGVMQNMGDPVIEFNNAITITGLQNSEQYRLEVQA